MATISDVAKRAGVSTYTVSAVMNRSAKVSPELTSRVLKAVNELDYTINYVARSLQTRKTETLGMLIPDIGNPTYAAVVRGVEDICNKHNYSLILGSTHNNQETQDRALALYRAKQVDGILLFITGDETTAQSVAQKKIPMVCVGRRPATFETDTVISDHKLGIKLAADHLISRGQRKIALLTGNPGSSVAKDSIAGWKAALKQADIPVNKDYALEGDWTSAGAFELAISLLTSEDRPTAFIATNVIMATGVLRAAKQLHLRVPDELEVFSGSDSEWLDLFETPISVIRHPNYEMGAESAELLFRRIAEPDRPFQHVVLKPELKIR